MAPTLQELSDFASKTDIGYVVFASEKSYRRKTSLFPMIYYMTVNFGVIANNEVNQRNEAMWLGTAQVR